MTPSVYFARMPVDIDAAVIANTRLSADYNVLSLAAPDDRRDRAPRPVRDGQDVGAARIPLLRRPFSIFEILRDAGRRAAGRLAPQQAHRRRHRAALDVEPGTRVACLGPLGRPFEPVDPPARSVDGRGRRRARAVRHAGRGARRARHADDAVLRRAPRRRALLRRALRRLGVARRARHRRRQPRRRAGAHRAARRARSSAARPRRPCSSTSAARRR